MTTIDEFEDCCIHGMLPPSSCTICTGKDRARAKAAAEVIQRFPARYSTRLACGHHVDVGDIIARRNDDSYVCGDCAATTKEN